MLNSISHEACEMGEACSCVNVSCHLSDTTLYYRTDGTSLFVHSVWCSYKWTVYKVMIYKL